MKGLKMPIYFLKMFFLRMIKQKSFCPPVYYLDYFESLNLFLLYFLEIVSVLQTWGESEQPNSQVCHLEPHCIQKCSQIQQQLHMLA